MNDSSQLSYRQIRVGRMAIGMIGLNELFSILLQQGFLPDDDASAELLKGARRYNYIAAGAEAETAGALLNEYRRFCERQSGQKSSATGYGVWRSWPRETVPWFPTIRDELCNGCGACLRFCQFGVYEIADDNRAIVIEPFRCQVGCSACASICKPGAIAFPPIKILEVHKG